ncbi:phosphoribosylanthranilate isomerase [Peribacillus sp. B-H-3]|uniref:phosphoribosylanthranilate isomerase n=1 Tax=Peribacillus sp. B-H-3 TaxID=3400420 RepID=UPI003B01AAE3
MKVKICGIRTFEAAQAAVLAGADYLGFIFAEGKRHISPLDAGRIISKIDSSVKKIGVFMNQPYEEIVETYYLAGLDYVQLHGEETAEFADSLPFPVIKAISLNSEYNFSGVSGYPASYFLLDRPKSAAKETLDWKRLTMSDFPLSELFLAGGLTPENVEEAIITVRPYAVDVSSGVETDGVKDIGKIRAFIRNAKRGSGEEIIK